MLPVTTLSVISPVAIGSPSTTPETLFQEDAAAGTEPVIDVAIDVEVGDAQAEDAVAAAFTILKFDTSFSSAASVMALPGAPEWWAERRRRCRPAG